jgi:hypothetical protein
MARQYVTRKAVSRNGVSSAAEGKLKQMINIARHRKIPLY